MIKLLPLPRLDPSTIDTITFRTLRATGAAIQEQEFVKVIFTGTTLLFITTAKQPILETVVELEPKRGEKTC